MTESTGWYWCLDRLFDLGFGFADRLAHAPDGLGHRLGRRRRRRLASLPFLGGLVLHLGTGQRSLQGADPVHARRLAGVALAEGDGLAVLSDDGELEAVDVLLDLDLRRHGEPPLAVTE